MTTTIVQKVTITVLESATIFVGSETIYRYDIGTESVIDGWALPAVLDQVKQIAAEDWPDIDVVIDGNEEIVEILTGMFVSKGLISYPIETEEEGENPPPDDTPSPTIKRPTSGKTVRHFYGIKPLHVLLVSILVGAVAGVWMLSGFMTAPSPPVSASQRTQTASEETDDDVAQNLSQPQPTVLVTQDLLIEAPYGFELREEEQSQFLEGEDPNLRIHVGVDLLHGADPAMVKDELQRLIKDDPALEEQQPGEWGDKETIDYVEAPGDGSRVVWVTWFDAGRQLNVGCHSKTEETLVHKAQCRSIIEHLTLK